MHLFKKLLAVAMFATAIAAPAVTPAANATHCSGSVTFVGGSPTIAVTNPVELVATFDTQGPGFIPAHCDLGWVYSCSMTVDGNYVPVDCPTGYAPEPDRCPSTGSCPVYVKANVNLSPGSHTVVANLTMQWGCCGYVGGPPASASGSWSVYKVGVSCTNDLCQKVRPIVKISGHDPFED